MLRESGTKHGNTTDLGVAGLALKVGLCRPDQDVQSLQPHSVLYTVNILYSQHQPHDSPGELFWWRMLQKWLSTRLCRKRGHKVWAAFVWPVDCVRVVYQAYLADGLCQQVAYHLLVLVHIHQVHLRPLAGLSRLDNSQLPFKDNT